MSTPDLPTPMQFYREQITHGDIRPDATQEQVVKQLEILHQELTHPQPWPVRLGLRRRPKTKGIYLWGSVGTGKTYLMDIFFHCLPFKEKLRMHFHPFMQLVHTELTAAKGQRAPLQAIAQIIAKKTRVLCLDELIVNDITDAMLLAMLFKALYDQGICVLFTSNIPPDRLYEKGLQRQQFLPAIDLIKSHSHTIELNTQQDYRQQYAQHHRANYTLTSEDSAQTLEDRFIQLCDGEMTLNDPILVHGRSIPVIKRSKHIIWFDFDHICGIPRSQKDYISLANTYQAILISGLHPIDKDQNNLIRSFINLVDVFYDQRTLLILHATVPIHEVYTQGKFLFPFARTQSRITEMQAEHWQK